MAKTQKTEEAKETEQMENQAENQAENTGEAITQNEAMPEATAPAASDAPDDAKNSKPKETEPDLMSISELAMKHRLATWQTAALLRLMEWTPEKQVSESEFASALNILHSRRIGGGRM